MSTIRDYMIDAIVQSTQYGEYRYEIHVIVDEHLGLPDRIKEKFGYGNTLMLVLRSDQNPDPQFDFNTGILSWNTTFDRVGSVVSVPIANILAITDPYTGQAAQFGIIQNELEKERPAESRKEPVESVEPKSVPKSEQKEPEKLKKKVEIPAGWRVIKGGKHE